MPVHLHLDCVGGISGNMLLGALFDLGIPPAKIASGLKSLPLEPWEFRVEEVKRGPLRATWCNVLVEGDSNRRDGPAPEAGHHGHRHGGGKNHMHPGEGAHRHGSGAPGQREAHGEGNATGRGLPGGGKDEGGRSGHPHDHCHRHRSLGFIVGMIEQSALPEGVKEKACRTFRLLAGAEGKVHGIDPEEVAFHEVGAVDAIVDIVGTCLAVRELGAETITCSPVPLGRGEVSSMHGRLPVPAPATVELLREVPLRQMDNPFEMTTPTGAALAVALSEKFCFLPEMVLEKTAYGAGGERQGGLPNVLRVFKGQVVLPAEEVVVQLETNVDNSPAEDLGYLLSRLMADGALDAFFTPITMKKNRPAQKLTCLCRRSDKSRLEELILRNVPTLGVRSLQLSRRVLARRHVTVHSPWGRARIKEAYQGSELLHAYPEYEDVAALAEKHKLGISEVRRRLMELYYSRATG